MAENNSIFHGLVDPPGATSGERTTESKTNSNSSQRRAIANPTTTDTLENVSSQFRSKDQADDGGSEESVGAERKSSNKVKQRGAIASTASPHSYKDQFEDVDSDEPRERIASNEAVQRGTRPSSSSSSSGPQFKDQFRHVDPHERLGPTRKGAFPSKSGPHPKDQLRQAGRNRDVASNRVVSQKGGSGPQYKDQLREATDAQNRTADTTYPETESSAANARTSTSPATDEQQGEPAPFAEARAVALSDSVLRQELLDDYFENIPLAEAAEPSKQLKLIPILVVLVVVIAIVGVAAVCGSGNCAPSQSIGSPISNPPTISSPNTPSPTINAEQRTADIVEFINERTFAGLLTYPSAILPEERALKWVIEDDPLQLTVSSNASRILQRYALVSLWYSGGAWGANVLDSNDQFWLIGEDECEWSGLVCSEENAVIAVSLQNDGLTGRIPADMGLLSALTRIDLDLNNLSGPIPDSFSELTMLNNIEMWRNVLTGTIPSSLSSLTALERFDIQENKLTGSIPDELTAWTRLDYAYFGFNDFTGSMPLCLMNRTFEVLHADCNDRFQCECCTQCL